MTEPTPEARLVRIGPIEVMARPATEGQVSVITKAAAAARRTKADGAVANALDIAFRVVETLLVDPADVDRIDNGLIDGSIKVSDLAGVLGLEDEDDKPKPTKARTRRSR